MGREIRRVPPNWEHPTQENGNYQPMCDNDFDTLLAEWEQEPTWYQVYETVSEGTPVTPPFATKKGLVNYLVQHGDFWDQRRGDGGWNREYAEHFVQVEWAPSGIFIISPEGKIEYKAPRDGA